MPLSFQTKDQQFIFADHQTRQIVNAMALRVGTTYEIYVVLTNTDPVEHTDVRVQAWHDGLGLGTNEDRSGLTQPSRISVPAAAFGRPGEATASFLFAPPAGGAGCLVAQLDGGPAAIRQVVSCEFQGDQKSEKTAPDGMLFYPLATGSFRGMRILAMSLE
jgi:hypothetical protein